MIVEVEIGTIQVNALPEGVTADALRTEIVAGLTMQVKAGGIAGVESGNGLVSGDIAPGGFDTLGTEIAHKIYRELVR